MCMAALDLPGAVEIGEVHQYNNPHGLLHGRTVGEPDSICISPMLPERQPNLFCIHVHPHSNPQNQGHILAWTPLITKGNNRRFYWLLQTTGTSWWRLLRLEVSLRPRWGLAERWSTAFRGGASAAQSRATSHRLRGRSWR